MSRELQRRLAATAERTGKGKNAIVVEALMKHLETLDRAALAVEARRQSERVSRREGDASWYQMADTTGWR